MDEESPQRGDGEGNAEEPGPLNLPWVQECGCARETRDSSGSPQDAQRMPAPDPRCSLLPPCSCC